MVDNCSSSLVSHINRSCEIGPGKVGVNNVHHEPVKENARSPLATAAFVASESASTEISAFNSGSIGMLHVKSVGKTDDVDCLQISNVSKTARAL
jgi:hypothetical protein